MDFKKIKMVVLSDGSGVYAIKDIEQLEAENKRLRTLAEFVLRFTVETGNAGVVFTHDPKTFRQKAEQALKGGE